MRKDKTYIFKLRQEGKSFRSIQKETGVSRGTLGKWFRGIEWSKHATQHNREGAIEGAKDRIIRMNMVRKLKLVFHYAQAAKEASDEFDIYKGDNLFHAGLMVYVGQGNKASKGVISVTGADFRVHKVFIAFIEKYLKISKDTVKCSLLLYPGIDSQLSKEKWAEELGLKMDQFYKVQVLKRGSETSQLHFGVGATILSGAYAKKKLLTWIELAFEQYI